jgi:hypothetical protein
VSSLGTNIEQTEVDSDASRDAANRRARSKPLLKPPLDDDETLQNDGIDTEDQRWERESNASKQPPPAESDGTELQGSLDDLAVTLEKAEKHRHSTSQSYQNQLDRKEDETREIRALVAEVIQKQEEKGDLDMIEIIMPSLSTARNEEIEVLRTEIKGIKEQAAGEKESEKANECNPFAIFSECLT